MMNTQIPSWKSTDFRRRVVQQLNEAFRSHPQYPANTSSPLQLEMAAYNRSSCHEDYIKNIKSILIMFRQQQQQQPLVQQQPVQPNPQQHGQATITHQYREHQIQSVRQQMMDQQHSMSAPSYPMMSQQHQQPPPQIDPSRSFMTQDHPPQQLQQPMYDGSSGRSGLTSTSFGNISHSAPYMKTGPANVTITSVSTSLPSSLPTSIPSFSVAPQPTAVDGSVVTAHYGPPGQQQRPPFNVHNYPTSAANSLPPSQDPSLSLLSQPSPGSPVTSAEEEQQYIQKRNELSQYIPTVMKVINKYTSRGTPEDAQRLQQVAKLRDFVRMLQDNTRRIPLSALAKWEVALKKIFPSTNVESNVNIEQAAPSAMHPPSTQPTAMMPQASAHAVSSRAPQLELHMTNSPTLSYTTPTIRENRLALQLMCKQQEKKNVSGVKSLVLLQRELEHLENYFVCQHEVDSKENCIVLTCTLVDDYLPTEIPALTVRIPDNYPTVPPEYVMDGYKESPFLANVERHVGKQLISMNLYSVTQLLHTWESSVRNAVTDIVASA